MGSWGSWGLLTLRVPPGGEDGDGFADPQSLGVPGSRGARGHFPGWKKSGNSGKSHGGKSGSVPPGGAASAEWHRWGRNAGIGTAGQPRPGGRWGTPYWGHFVLVTGPSLCSLLEPVCLYCSQFVFPMGAALRSLLVPVCPPSWSQSLFPTGPSLSLLVPVLCPQQSQSLLTGASLSSLVPVPVPNGSCGVLLVPVCLCWS